MKNTWKLFLVVILFSVILSACTNTDMTSVPPNGNVSKTISSKNTNETTNPSKEPVNNEETNNPSKDPKKSVKPEDMIELSKEYEIRIKQTRLDYLHNQNGCQNATLDDVFIKKYYGTYNNSAVVMITDNFTEYTDNEWNEIIHDVKIRYVNGNYIVVWREGVFHKLQSAYNQDFLNKEDLIKIATIQNQ